MRWWWFLPVGIFVLTRLIDAMFLVSLGHEQFDQAEVSGILGPVHAHPDYESLVTNWDGQWYRRVALDGYPVSLPRDATGQVEQNTWAFYPLYPVLCRSVMLVTGLPFGLAASLVSMMCGGLAMCLLWRLVRRRGGSWAATMAVTGLCAAPAAVVFQVAYSESLVLLLVLCAAWAIRERRYGLLLAIAVALAFARPVVIALSLALVLHGVLRWRRRDQESFPPGQIRTVGAVAVASALLFGVWPLCAWLATGEPRAYLLTQAAWPEPAYDGLAPSWLMRSVHGEPVALVVVVCGLLVSLGLLVARRARVWSEELRVFSASYVAVVLLVVSPGTFATLRYALPSAVGWWPFPTLGSKGSGPVRAALVVLVITLGAFVQGWWILWFWIIGPHHHYHP